jgi:hypothetical protein
VSTPGLIPDNIPRYYTDTDVNIIWYLLQQILLMDFIINTKMWIVQFQATPITAPYMADNQLKEKIK